MNKIEKICFYAFLFIFGVIITYLLSMSMLTTAYMYDWEDTLFINDKIWQNVAAIVVVILVFLAAVQKKFVISDRFVKCYILAVNILMIWFVVSTQFVSVDDQHQVISAASAFLDGNYEPWNEGGYCFRWEHQNGIVLIYAFLSMLFGKGNTLVFQLLNVVFIFITYICIYRSFYKIVPERGNASKVILMALYTYLPYLMYVTYIYGTVIGMMFAAVGMYLFLCFLDELKIRYAAGSVLAFSMATVCKSNYYIIVISVCIVMFFVFCNAWKEETVRNRWKRAGYVVSLIGMCFILRFTTTAIVEHAINKEVPEGTPAILFVVMGIQEGFRAPGWSNSFDDNLYQESGYNREIAEEAGFQWFKNEAVKFYFNPDYMVRFFNEKLASIWVNPTFECFEIQKERVANVRPPGLLIDFMDVGGLLNTFVIGLMNLCQSVMYFGVLLYILTCTKKVDFKSIVFAIAFVGVFLFHIIWEARCHYTVAIITFLIPYSVLGYEKLAEIISAGEIRIKKFSCVTTFVLIGFILTCFMKNFSIVEEKNAYENFLNHYAYRTRLDGETRYTIKTVSEPQMALTLNNTEDGCGLCIAALAEDDMNQRFHFKYNFYENGVNTYLIQTGNKEQILFLRDESWTHDWKVYTHHYDLNPKNFWRVEQASENAYYIKNIYGMALAYNIYTNDVLMIPFNGEENQQWIIE